MGKIQARSRKTRGQSAYTKGDYVKIQLLPGIGDNQISVWIRVDHCDDQHGIVFGEIESEPPDECGPGLRRGAKLAASYWSVQQRLFTRPSSRFMREQI